jgi:hypothetical protein
MLRHFLFHITIRNLNKIQSQQYVPLCEILLVLMLLMVIVNFSDFQVK